MEQIKKMKNLIIYAIIVHGGVTSTNMHIQIGQGLFWEKKFSNVGIQTNFFIREQQMTYITGGKTL